MTQGTCSCDPIRPFRIAHQFTPSMSSWLPRLTRNLPNFSNISHLNPTPQFPPHTGPHCVGSSDIELAASSLPESVEPSALRPDTIAFRLFYPCSPSVRHKSSKAPNDKIYWIQDPQHSTVSAYARFLGATPAIANLLSVFPQLLYHIRIQAHRDAPLADLPLSSPGSPNHDRHVTPADRWPVLVFSHGLGGSRFAYSHLCACLASHGIVVIAVDHRDGSQPIAYTRPSRPSEPEQHEEMQSVDYQRISHTASPQVFEARDQQLKIRLWECSTIVELLACLDLDELPSNLQDLPPQPNKYSKCSKGSWTCGQAQSHLQAIPLVRRPLSSSSNQPFIPRHGSSTLPSSHFHRIAKPSRPS